MCGIAGLVDLDGLDPAVAKNRSQAAIARIDFRGPDDRGTWSDRHCALVHTRLAIIDLSSLGHQPMRRDGMTIVFNGEIFNYATVRDDLRRCGHEFKSGSDTEVILAGWRQWGEQLLPRMTGMFAFAIWDERNRTLFAARDRFGEKPLLYTVKGRTLAFGSDLIACEAMLGEKRAVDPAALRALFTLRFVPEPWSIAQGVQKLPAGHWLKFNDAGLAVTHWYELAKERPAAPSDDDLAERELRERFDAAVRDRLVSDVPVGVFLSSGIDSSIVAASVAASGAKLRTFTVGFEGAANYYEERPAAAAVARHLGAEHNEISISADRAADVLDRVFGGLDEPFADSSALPTYLVSEATRRKVTVVLTGDGADEVFGGYRRYWSELYATQWNRLPTSVRGTISAFVGSLPESKNNRLLETIRRARRFVMTMNGDPVRRQTEWMRLMPDNELNGLLGPERAADIRVEQLVDRYRAAAYDSDSINATLACDMALELPSDMLVKVDRMSMVHALETRAPFLDQRVVEWAFALPGAKKLSRLNGWPVGKRILRSAFRNRLPAEVFSRPKRGFEMPVGTLLLTTAASRLASATDPVALQRQGLFNPDIVQGWHRDLNSGRRDTAWQLWTMLAFQEWARLHGRPEALSA